MQDDVAIRVENLSKVFKLPHEKHSSLKSAFINFYKTSRKYEKQHALNDISFEVKRGEFFGVVGRNGSGKSTLLKILAGVYRPTSGGVQINGKLVPFIELGVGFNPELSGRDNVFLNGALLGFSRKEMQAMYKDIVDFAELGKFMDQKLKNYSSGMQVRLAFSVAIRARSDILLIDEVLAVGDADFQRKCYRYFKRLKNEKKTVMLVTHDMDAVREYCDEAILINEQKIVTIASPDKTAREYAKIMLPEQTNAMDNETERWGDGTLNIRDVKVTNAGVDYISFNFVAVAKKDCADPIFGFRIRNSAGQSLLGTNSMLLGQKARPMKKNDRARINWQVRNIFTDGEYYIDPSVVYEGTMTAADWWDAAVSFQVNRERHTPYLVEPEMSLKIETW